MMDNRNWLIRTKSNKILGPLSKQKVIEFVQDGTLTDEDEICSGNGYWFWIKEDDLLNRYLFGEEEQNFNPVSEAKTKVASSVTKLVKTTGIVDKIKDFKEDVPSTPPTPQVEASSSGAISISTNEDDEEIVLPEDGDLDFPEPIDYSNNTLPQHDAPVNASPLKDLDSGVSMSEVALAMNIEEEEEIILPCNDDLDFPDVGSTQNTISLEKEEESSAGSQIDLLVAEAEAEVNVQKEESEAKPDLDNIAEDARLILESEKLADLPKSAPVLNEDEDSVQPMKVVEMPRPRKKKVKKKSGKSKKKKRKSDYSFVYLAIGVLIILLFFISKFYSKLVGKDLFSKMQFKMPTTTVLAQEFQVDKKKRYF
ncbi:hypothetical protein M902_0487 [Bacteriovorax sp. BAL6_X]|uniref:hypothetical protein n=1 Tax=Bacteriovorax sp. BAL6_X TaxID=1201290 RepID=UPI0003869461|nr:hypothetical protein [Bacteriovorax sp. BAL6_X]EPZ49526.1 hypothetical protein M902_0487 [Bacteriovorax sp. BAL6_X]